MNEWQKVKLKEICEFKYGKNLPENSRVIGEFPVYGSSNIVSYHKEYLINGPGIIIGRKGTVGKVQYSKTSFFPIDTTFYVKEDKSKVDLKFLYYTLPLYGLDKMNSDAAVPGLNREAAISIKILLPPLPTQRRIAPILNAYDDLIENNLKRIKLLEEIAQRTYEEWFVKFRVNGEQLHLDDNTGLPVGWRFVQLSEIVDFSQGIQVDIENQFSEKEMNYTRFIRIVDVTQGEQEPRYIITPLDKFIVKEEDLFMVRYGAPQIVTGMSGVIANNFFKIIIKNENELLRKYLYGSLNRNVVKEYLLAISTSSTMPAISFSSFGAMKIILADMKVQIMYDKHAKSVQYKILNLKYQNQKLKESRDILLPKLMNGTIKVD